MSVNKETCGSINRLEDFIGLAKQGKKINLKVELTKYPIISNQPPEKRYLVSAKKDMYLLIADFLFGNEPDIITISKVYAMGCADEAATEDQSNKEIANARLKMDYERLKKVSINFEEKFF